MLTDSRNQLVQADKLSGLYLGGNPNLAEASRRIPEPYRFVLKRLPPASRP